MFKQMGRPVLETIFFVAQVAIPHVVLGEVPRVAELIAGGPDRGDSSVGDGSMDGAELLRDGGPDLAAACAPPEQLVHPALGEVGH